MSKTVVVFGATGFVGSQVTKFLIKRGFNVRAVCRDISQDTQKWMYDGTACNDVKKLSFHQFSFPSDLVPPLETVDSDATPTRSKIISNIYDNVLNAETKKVYSDDSGKVTKVQETINTIQKLLQDTCGAVFCVGFEHQNIETINFMVGSALMLLHAAATMSSTLTESRSDSGYPIVLTSSTGSTNKPGADPLKPKTEGESWSDPDTQLKNGRYSPCAKTLMELEALKYVGRDQENNKVSYSNIRLSIINPSLILGNQLRPGPILGNGLPWFCKICRGEAMNENVPNDSMSLIHVEELAMLHAACIENKNAYGRYFGVDKSYEWRVILKAIKENMKELGSDFKIPQQPFKDEEAKPVTLFDGTRRDEVLKIYNGEEFYSKGELMSIDENVRKTIQDLKVRGALD